MFDVSSSEFDKAILQILIIIRAQAAPSSKFMRRALFAAYLVHFNDAILSIYMHPASCRGMSFQKPHLHRRNR